MHDRGKLEAGEDYLQPSQANNVKIIDFQADLKNVLVDWLGSTASGFTERMCKRFFKVASLTEHVMDIRDRLSDGPNRLNQ